MSRSRMEALFKGVRLASVLSKSNRLALKIITYIIVNSIEKGTFRCIPPMLMAQTVFWRPLPTMSLSSSPGLWKYSLSNVLCPLLQLLPYTPTTKSNSTISTSSHLSLAFSCCCGPTSPTLPSLNLTVMLQPLDPNCLHQHMKLIPPSLFILLPLLYRKTLFGGSGPQSGE